MAKKILNITQEEVNGPITFKVEGFDPVTIDPKQLPEEIRSRLMDYGLTAKVSRSIAGKGGDPEAAYASMKAVVEALQAGNWNLPRAGGGGQSASKVAKAATLAALAKVPSQVRKQVAEQLIKDGAPITMDDLVQAGLV